MRRRPIFSADINLAAAEKTPGIIRSEGGEAVANRADEEQTSPTAANLALLRRTNATAHYSIEAICIGHFGARTGRCRGSHQLKIMPIALCRSIGAAPKGLWCCVAQRRRLWFRVAQTLRPSGVAIASSLSNSSNVIIESRRRGMQTRSRERTGAGGSFNWGAPKRKSETQRPLPHGA